MVGRVLAVVAGTTTTLAGGVPIGSSGDGASGAGAELTHPTAIAFDASGAAYIADAEASVEMESEGGNAEAPEVVPDEDAKVTDGKKEKAGKKAE